MNKFKKLIAIYIRDRRGATAIEYCLMITMIAMAILTVVFLLGGHISDIFGYMSTSMSQANSRIAT